MQNVSHNSAHKDVSEVNMEPKVRNRFIDELKKMRSDNFVDSKERASLKRNHFMYKEVEETNRIVRKIVNDINGRSDIE